MSKADLFGKDSLLAIASKLSKNKESPLDASDLNKIARLAKLRFMELCADSLLKKARNCALDDTEIGALATQIPRDACKDALSGAFWLMSVYEHLSAFSMHFDQCQWTVKSAKASKRKRGQYFTPRNLTQFATQTALQKLVEVKFGEQAQLRSDDIAALRIVDPAMGAGAFLVCALDYFARKINDLRIQDIAANCLYGVDADPLAADVTYLAITTFCSLKLGVANLSVIPKLKEHLRVGNSLVGCWSENPDPIADSTYKGELEKFEPDSFHWQLEFADVFARGGFDAVLSNPPWETLKPNIKEFFSTDEREYMVNFSRFLRTSADRAKVIKAIRGFNFPFKAQGGSDLNSYKLFVELSFCMLAKNGCMSLIVPSGVYTDHGTMALRQLLLEEADIFEVTSYLNKDQAFAIHPSFNFCVFSVCNRKTKGEIKVSFGNRNASDTTLNTLPAIKYPLADLHTFSPMWRSLLEVNDAKDLEILRKIYSLSKPLAETVLRDGAQIKFKREFDLTNDSPSFVSRTAALKDGYVGDQFGNLLKGNWRALGNLKSFEKGFEVDAEEEIIFSREADLYIKTNEVNGVLLPLYEGRMLGQFDCRQKAHISGTGRTALWQANQEDSALIQSQYFLPLDEAQKRSNLNSIKIGYQAVGSSTNVRTMIAAALSGIPCGNSVPVLTAGQDVQQNLALLASLNSFVFDFVLRSKMTGNNINFYLLQECPLPDLSRFAADSNMLSLAACLSFKHRRFAREFLQLLTNCDLDETIFDSYYLLSRSTLRAALDAVVAQAYGLEFSELAWILRDGTDNDSLLKGFWRVDKAIEPTQRHTYLTLEFYRRLLEVGDAEFLRTLVSSNAQKSSNAKAFSVERRLRQLKIDAENLDAIYAKELPLSRSLPRIGR